MDRWTPWIATLLACLCAPQPARAAVLSTDLRAEIDADYRPRDADEERIWRHLGRLEAVVRDSPQRLVAPDLESYLRSILERLLGRPAPEFRIYLMRDASFNAAMFPSGMLIVNTGVLPRIRGEAQFAAILGHEAGHYFRRHSLERYRELQRKSATAELTSAATMNSGGPYAAQPWIQISRVATLSYFRFSRNQESEADAYGLMLMARAGYSPLAAPQICRQLKDERKASTVARGKRFVEGADAALSTHPPTGRRISDLVDTAKWWVDHGAPAEAVDDRDAWPGAIRPHLASLLHEQVYLNDPGASLYLLEGLAARGWTSLLRSSEGDVYALRAADGDSARAAAAYAAAADFPDAVPDAGRAQLDSLASAPMVSGASRETRSDIAAGTVVAGSRLKVWRDIGWQSLPASERRNRWEEVWTWNGAQIDRLTLVGGMPGGAPLVPQGRDATQRVPALRADMAAPDLAAMLEVSYRVNGVSLFEFDSVESTSFLGGSGLRLSYHYASGIGNAKRGRCVMRIVDGRLYLIKLEGVAHRSFDAAAAAFERLVGGARLRD